MKVSMLFVLLALAFVLSESQQISKQKIVCVRKDKLLNVLKGRDGVAGLPGLKGDKGVKGDDGLPGRQGDQGFPGIRGIKGCKGQKGIKGEEGPLGWPGEKGILGERGEKGDPGQPGYDGDTGYGFPGDEGDKGSRGLPGFPGLEIQYNILLSLLNDYYVVENGYYNKLYHVTSRALTDGRTDTGGWGSVTAKTGNYIQATYVRPVYVTSFTVAGGYIPSWDQDTKRSHGFMDLEYSADGKTWKKVYWFKTAIGKKMITRNLTVPVTARYWRLISTDNKWVGTTEFVLKPLVKPAFTTRPA